jgi:murein tripeptide amidase MpaA
LNQLLRSTDPEVRFIAENVDWYIVPMANPDGYEYTRSSNRNWRKTRSQTSLICWGVDPNRNFAYNWLVKDESGDEGASRAPCSDLYAGSKPFSENETIALNDFMTKHHEKFDVYLSFHSYAHQILFPMGHTRVRIVSICCAQMGREFITKDDISAKL